MVQSIYEAKKNFETVCKSSEIEKRNETKEQDKLSRSIKTWSKIEKWRIFTITNKISLSKHAGAAYKTIET